MKRLKGPELKLTGFKVPLLLQDLYWDLRDRRLLPLVGLVIVAIIAVPFLLGGGDESAHQMPSPHASGSAAEQTSLSVVAATPGLREPSKRLRHRAARNPFRQHYTGPVFKPGAAPIAETSSDVGSQESSTEVTEIPSEGSIEIPSEGSSATGATPEALPAPTPVPTEPSSSGGHKEGGSAQPGEIQVYFFSIDLKVAHTEATDSGAKKMGEAVILQEVERGSPLPGKKAPVLTYLGVDGDAKRAMMLISLEATALFGDNECLAGTSTCQLIALEPEMPEVVEYGENGGRYKFELLKIEPVKGPKIEAPQG